MYTSLGVVSAYTGALLGTALQSPWTVAVMCLFLITLSLYTLDIIQVDLAYKIQARASLIGGKGYLGAFLMGTVSGLVAAPCAAPLLITILGLAAHSANPLWGALLLFVYALGFGLLFLALGTFSGLIHKLPRSGDWLHIVKFFISAALLTVAIFLIRPLLPAVNLQLDPGQAALFVSVFGLIALLVATIGRRRHLRSIKFLCACVLAIALYQLVFERPSPPATAVDIRWESNVDRAIAMATQKRQLVMIDFFAEWCAACKQLEQNTFRDPAVQDKLRALSLARVDLTLASDLTDAVQQRFVLLGLPSILFLCPNGVELPDTRLEGFKDPTQFLDHLARVQAKGRNCRPPPA